MLRRLSKTDNRCRQANKAGHDPHASRLSLASFAVDITAVIETWYRNKETGQIFSLHPLINRPGLWMDVDPNDLIEPGQRVQCPIDVTCLSISAHPPAEPDRARESLTIQRLAKTCTHTWTPTPRAKVHVLAFFHRCSFGHLGNLLQLRPSPSLNGHGLALLPVFL